MKDKLITRLNKYLSELIALIAIILFSVIGGVYISKKVFLLGLIFFVSYVVFFTVFRFFKKDKKDKNAELFTNVTVELLMSLKMPVAILDSEGLILWFNQCFAEKSGEKNLYNTNINELLETRFNINHLKEQLDGESLDALLSGVKYRVDSYLVESGSEAFYITVWNDLTVEEELRSKLDATNSVLAYIYVDNSVDASSYVNSDYRAATAKVSGILTEWVSSMNGIIKEFDRDKYIALFDKSNVAAVVESKFDVLDRVREVSDTTDIPISVSIGVSCLDDATLKEKEQVAHQSLDLAMQRGGDQAVLRYNVNSDIFGGKQKPVQKRTKIRSRFIAEDIIKLLNNCGNVLIMGHLYADFDSIGSCIGMAAFSMNFCDKVNIVINRNDKNIASVLEKAEKIDKYKNVFIDAVTAQDIISHNTLLIICDVNNPDIFESREIYENVKDIVIIDHHRKSGNYIVEPKKTHIEPSASSASELVSEIIEQTFQPNTLNGIEAEALFAGIVLDTKGFTRNAGMRTFLAAHYLRGEGAVPAAIDNYFKTSFDDFVNEAKFEIDTQIYRNKIAITMVDNCNADEDKITAARVAERLMKIKGVSAAFALCKINNTTHISARSDGNVNVQLILEKLNGGGHFESAGAQIAEDPIEQVLIRLKNAIDEYLEVNS